MLSFGKGYTIVMVARPASRAFLYLYQTVRSTVRGPERPRHHQRPGRAIAPAATGLGRIAKAYWSELYQGFFVRKRRPWPIFPVVRPAVKGLGLYERSLVRALPRVCRGGHIRGPVPTQLSGWRALELRAGDWRVQIHGRSGRPTSLHLPLFRPHLDPAECSTYSRSPEGATDRGW